MSDNRELVRAWFEQLDLMDYFQILHLERPRQLGEWPTDENLRRAFGAFAAAFHPDRYKGEDPDTVTKVTTIFRRGNEAFRVLGNPGLRARYVRHLAKGKVRLEGEELTRKPTMQAMQALQLPTPGAPEAPAGGTGQPAPALSSAPFESLVTNPSAVNFAQEADKLLARGDLKKALFQLQMAQSKEPTNMALADRIAALNSGGIKK